MAGWVSGLLGRLKATERDREPAATTASEPTLSELQKQAGSTSDAALLEEMRRLGPIVSRLLRDVGRSIRPGMTTQAIADALARGAASDRAAAAMLDYRGFPAAAAVSVNDEIVHGIPGRRVLADGDLVKVEFRIGSGIAYAGQSWTFPVGDVSAEDRVLLDVGPRALRAALLTLKHHVRLGDIGAAIQTTVEDAGLAVVRDFVGYGMGRQPMQDPQIKGYGRAGFGPRIAASTVLNLHVIFKHGGPEVAVMDNEWTARALDGKRGGIFTCMAELTNDGHRLLTPFIDLAQTAAS